jgi:metal-dependent amidase/aminoacylase/carboxypeptidase family protein
MTALESPLLRPVMVPSLPTQHVAEGRGPSWLDEWLSSNGADLITWRRYIHAHPELAYHEQGTTALITELLTSAGLQPMLLPRGTGLICDIGSGQTEEEADSVQATARCRRGCGHEAARAAPMTA